MRKGRTVNALGRDAYADEVQKARGVAPKVPEEAWKERIARIYGLMEEKGFDAVLIFGSPYKPNWVRYLANYVHPIIVSQSLVVLRRGREPILLIDRPWYLKTAREMSWLKDVGTFPYVEFRWQIPRLAKLFRTLFKGAKRVGVMEGDLPTLYGEVLKGALNKTEIKDTTELLFEFAAAKSEFDKKMIRYNAGISDAGMRAALRACREGAPEYEAGLRAEREMVKRGADVGTATVRTHLYIASSSRVLSNVRPFGFTGRKMEKGDLFFIDLTSSYMGYYADMCRSVCIGEPTKKQLKLFRIVEESYHAMLDNLRPGVSGEKLYRLACAIAKKSGYEKYINHVWLGHGTGIVNSEPPFMHPGEKRTYRAGSFVNIEPGLFVDGIGCPSIEDMTYVSEKGAAPVNRCDRSLKIG